MVTHEWLAGIGFAKHKLLEDVVKVVLLLGVCPIFVCVHFHIHALVSAVAVAVVAFVAVVVVVVAIVVVDVVVAVVDDDGFVLILGVGCMKRNLFFGRHILSARWLGSSGGCLDGVVCH